MPFQTGNPYGGRTSHGIDALTAVQCAIRRGIASMTEGGKRKGKRIGVVRLAEKITAALEQDPIRTLKALSAYMPRNVSIDLTNTKDADALSDSELAQIIADHAARKITEGDEPDSIDAMMH